MTKRILVRELLPFVFVLIGVVFYSILAPMESFAELLFLKSRVGIVLFFSGLVFLAWMIFYLLRLAGGKRIFFVLIGMLLGRFASFILTKLFIPDGSGFELIMIVFCVVLGVLIALRVTRSVIVSSDFPFFSFIQTRKRGVHARPKVVDTSVVIDGRIADVIDAGFIEGVFIVPEFVLGELQQIADSADAIKRSRGRRGLDMLNRMKSSSNCTVVISPIDFPNIHEVDAKLVELSLRSNAMLLTNDFNLNKVAALKGIKVLNINELANALKSNVLPGEEMTVTIIKEGKDPHQGIAYLDDGTMIVVDKGRTYLNQRVPVMVTSVFQTPAGRMIFAHPIK